MKWTHLMLLAALPIAGCPADTDPPNDDPPTGTELGDTLLGDRNISGAHDAYVDAADADPNDLGAQAGAVATELALLLESAAIDDVLTACNQPTLDIQGQVFGPQGVLAHEEAHRLGTSTLALQRGAPAGSLQPSDFDADTVYASFYSGSWGSEIDLSITDRSAGTAAEKIELGFYVDLSDPTWIDGASFTLPFSNVDVWLWVNDDNGSMAMSTWFETVSGTIDATQAAGAAGETLELVFTDVTFHRIESDGMNDTVVEVFELNGTVTDTVMGQWEPAPGSMPFDGLDFIDGPPQKSEIIQIIEACGTGMNVSYLQTQLDAMFVDIRAMRARLDIIANSPNAAGFVWRLPAGVLTNSIDIPIGIVEVHALRAVIHGLEAANEIVQQYNFLGSDFIDLIGLLDPYYDWDCVTNCPDVTTRVDFDPALVGADLNANFLAVKNGSLDMSGAKASYLAALLAAKDALQATPTGNVLFNFQGPVARPGTLEIISFVDLLSAAADSPQTLTETPDWVLHPSLFFTAPFDRASLLAGTGVGDIFNILATDTTPGFEDNGRIDIEQAVVEAIIETFIDVPAAPTSTTYCRDNLDCSSPHVCNGWDDVVGVCADDMTTPCTWDGGECGMSWCVQDTCDVGAPGFFDYDVVDQAYNGSGGGPPTFVDADLWEELSDAF